MGLRPTPARVASICTHGPCRPPTQKKPRSRGPQVINIPLPFRTFQSLIMLTISSRRSKANAAGRVRHPRSPARHRFIRRPTHYLQRNQRVSRPWGRKGRIDRCLLRCRRPAPALRPFGAPVLGSCRRRSSGEIPAAECAGGPHGGPDGTCTRFSAPRHSHPRRASAR